MSHNLSHRLGFDGVGDYYCYSPAVSVSVLMSPSSSSSLLSHIIVRSLCVSRGFAFSLSVSLCVCVRKSGFQVSFACVFMLLEATSCSFPLMELSHKSFSIVAVCHSFVLTHTKGMFNFVVCVSIQLSPIHSLLKSPRRHCRRCRKKKEKPEELITLSSLWSVGR